MKPALKPLVVSAPFGNWISHPEATSTLGTYTLRNRAGRLRWYMAWRILKTLRRHRRIGAWTNSLGLPSPGLASLIWRCESLEHEGSGKYCKDKVLSIHGFDDGEWQTLIREVVRSELQPLALELNVSCVAANTRIVTREGYLKACELLSGTMDVLTEYGVAKSSGVQQQGIRPTLRIRTATNSSIRVTQDHRLKTLDANGRIEWKRADELQPGDYLLRKKGAGGMIPPDRGETPGFWYLVGFLYGDGSRYEHGPLAWSVAENKNPLIPELERNLMALGVEFSVHTRPASNRNGVNRTESETNLIGSCSRISDVLPPWKPNGKWRTSGVPDSLWTQGETQIAAFLRGIYDTDGCVSINGSTITLSATRVALLKDVQELLLLFGVVTTIGIVRRAPTPADSPFAGSSRRSFALRTIGPKSMMSFRSKIGFLHPHKAAMLSRAISKSERRLRDRILGYPMATNAIRGALPVGTFMGGTRLNDSTNATIRAIRHGRTAFLSDAKLHDVLARIDSLGGDRGKMQHLREYADNDWWFDKVTSIRHEGSLMPVYDVIGSETGSYVSSGFVSHNCPNVGELSVPDWLFARAIATGIPVVVKLPPVRWKATFERALGDGVRAFHACNTLPTPAGGMSGKPLKAVALDVVKAIKDAAPDALVIGGGGITTPEDVDDYAKAGADRFAVGSALLNGWHLLFPWTRRDFLLKLAARASMRTTYGVKP